MNQLFALFNTGRYSELESSALILIKQYPNSGLVWMGLGLSLQIQGKDALHALQKTADLLPDDPTAHNNLANALREYGQLDGALLSCRRALKIRPNFAEAHSNLGLTQLDLGHPDFAVPSFRRAIEIKPDLAEAHSNLGLALLNLGHLDASLSSCRRALEIKPDFADAHNNLGNALQAVGKFDDAVISYRHALKINPSFAKAHYNLGNALKNQDRLVEAISSYQHALQLNPDYAEAHSNMGVVLHEMGQFDDALASYRRALQLKPDYSETYSNMGITLRDIGQLDAALAYYQHALKIKPDFAGAQTNLLFTLNYTSGHARAHYLAEARKYGQMVAKKATSRFSAWQCAAQPERLRVGMVSGDLHNHPVGYFLESLLAQLDLARIELIAYPADMQVDELTARIRPFFAAWKPLVGLSDEAAARQINADGVHVLLDLSGHTGKNRLPVFAWKPAPVQASWLGYFATTGVAEMDYLLADEVGVPEARRGDFSETLWYLPDTRLCFAPPEADLPVASLPASQNGYITFGCFQNLSKVGNEVLAVWGEILAALPGAKLRWQCKQFGDPAVAKQLAQRLQLHGIDPARVSLHGMVSREVYLSAHAGVDVILDTFPYPGGTTTCEALWMGVPTLSLAGDTLLSRQGASLLTAAGLEDWVVTSTADYIDRAVELSGDMPKLAALRARLRGQVKVSPLFDAGRFARNLDAALWGMWLARTQSNSSAPELHTASRD